MVQEIAMNAAPLSNSPAGKAFAAIDRLKTLQTGWDSYDADPPDPFALTYAKEFLTEIMQALGSSFANPIVGPTAESGVALVWRKKGQGEVDAFFSPAGGRYVVIGSDRKLAGQIKDYRSFAVEILKPFMSQ